jgi:hypothetical protein
MCDGFISKGERVKNMTTYGSGAQASSDANSFMGLAIPIHLPSLAAPDGVDSPHLPQGHHSQPIEVIGFSDTPAEAVGRDFGQIDYYKYINNDNDILKTATLCVKLAPLTGAGGQYRARYVDDILCAAIDHVEWRYGGAVLQTLYGDEMHFRLLQESLPEELNRKYALQGAGLSDEERAALAEGEQWVYLELPFWWTRSPDTHWHQYAFQRQTQIIIYWRPVTYLTQMDNAVTPTVPTPSSGTRYVMDAFIRFSISTPTEAVKQTYMRLVEARGKAGYLYPIPDLQRDTEHVLAQNSTKNSVVLQNFRKFCYNIRYIVRPTANLVPNVLNNRRWDLVEIVEHYADISGRRYFPIIDNHYTKDSINGKYYLGNSQLPLYNIPFTDYPDLHTHGMGGFEMAQTVNPTITITTLALPAECMVDFFAYNHNYVRLVMSGTATAGETVQPAN